MLEHKILELAPGVSYGSVTLRSLQNDSVPELDLLVREAIQNSSDAALQESGDSFRVSFSDGFFRPSAFNAYMTGLEGRLNEMFPEDRASFMEIRDTGTRGLTGHIRTQDIDEDDHGNFFKLIFDTGKRQTQPRAGGNWGFGKSVYYRVGLGIVIFYSRIKCDEGYESRLIITLVEDESKKTPEGTDATLLKMLQPNSVGKAWWGRKDGKDLLPVTDQETIEAILHVFALTPFKPDETGTSIIIPYIDKKKLLDDLVPHETEVPDDVREHYMQVYGGQIEDYLRLSIQKWYAPKIHNLQLKKLPGDRKWLHVIVKTNQSGNRTCSRFSDYHRNCIQLLWR